MIMACRANVMDSGHNHGFTDHGHVRGCCKTVKSTVGAVCERVFR